MTRLMTFLTLARKMGTGTSEVLRDVPVPIFLLCLLIFSTITNAAEDTVKLVKNIKPAVVLIQTFDANNSPLAAGSGFFIDNKGNVITNHHVIEGAYSATVKTSAGKEYQVTGILAKDTEADIVKLSCGLISLTQNPKLKTQNSFVSPSSDPNFPFLKLSKQIPSEGEDIVVVGNPLGLESSVSTGIVSAVRKIPDFGNIIQITAPISPGSSGSPVVNSKGEVIGVATLIASKGQNLNFAMPSDKIAMLKEMAKSIGLKEYLIQVSKSDANDAQKLYEEGLQKVWVENWIEALSYFKKATQANPQNADAWFYLGVCYGELGRYQEEIDSYQQAIKIKPDYAEAHYNLGTAYGKLGRYADAIEACKQAIKINPDFAEAHYNLGIAYGKLGRYVDAIEAIKQTIRIKTDDADAYCSLGAVYGKLGRYPEAVEAIKQAIRIKPNYATAHYNLGNTYGELGYYQDAIEASKQAIRIKPDYVDAHYNLGLAYLLTGDKGSALDEYKILKNLDAEQANKLFNLIYK